MAAWGVGNGPAPGNLPLPPYYFLLSDRWRSRSARIIFRGEIRQFATERELHLNQHGRARRARRIHHIMTLSAGGRRMGAPSGTSNAAANSSMFERGPLHRNSAGAWGLVFTIILRYSGRYLERHMEA